jgi:hypothetical protein
MTVDGRRRYFGSLVFHYDGRNHVASEDCRERRISPLITI